MNVAMTLVCFSVNITIITVFVNLVINSLIISILTNIVIITIVREFLDKFNLHLSLGREWSADQHQN